MGLVANERKFKCAELEKKRKLKFDEYYERYEIMRDMSTNRCPYIHEQDRTVGIKMFTPHTHTSDKRQKTK